MHRVSHLCAQLSAASCAGSNARVPPEYTEDSSYKFAVPNESGKIVLVTRPIVNEGLLNIRRNGHTIVMLNELRLSEDEFIAAVKHYRADAVVSMLSDPLSARVLKAISAQVKVVAQYAVGTDNIDLAAAKKLSLPVTSTPGVLTEATADNAFSLLIAAARRIVAGDDYVRQGRFKRFETKLLLGPSLSGKTLGIFGFGRIGQAMAERGRGFGMKIIYFDSNRMPAAVEDKLQAKFVSKTELLQQSDFISLHCNLCPSTRYAFTRKDFAKMKPSAIIVNNSRGPVICEADLAWALHNGVIAGAGLDVFEKEPTIHPDLLSLPKDKVTLAPHLGSATFEARQAMSRMCGEAVVAALAGRTVPHRAA